MSYYKNKNKSIGFYGYDDYEDDYSLGNTSYGGFYNSKPKYKYGGFDRSIWSGYSWGGNIVVDDNSKLFVKEPLSYETPTSRYIGKKINNYTSNASDTVKELARVCYLKMIGDKDYISELYSDYDSLSDGGKEDYDRKKSLFDTVYENFIPGNTPLEQAIAIYKKASSSKREFAKSKHDDDDEIDYDSTLSFDRRLYSDPELNEQLNYNQISKENKVEIINNISIVGEFGSQFKVEKEVSEKIVANSREYSKKIMRDHAQLSQIDLYQKMFPNFSTKFLTKDLTVNVPVEKKEQKQKIIILLDFSGSMDENEKQIWVNAILIDRFRYVIKGEAEVFFSYFVYNPNVLHFQHIKNKEDVVKFWTSFSNQPNGGCTEIGDIVNHVSNEIDLGRLCNLDVDLSEEKPEILIINDGQDTVDSDGFPYKVNAVSLNEISPSLKRLCVESSGKQVFIDTYKKSVTCYSSEGEVITN